MSPCKKQAMPPGFEFIPVKLRRGDGEAKKLYSVIDRTDRTKIRSYAAKVPRRRVRCVKVDDNDIDELRTEERHSNSPPLDNGADECDTDTRADDGSKLLYAPLEIFQVPESGLQQEFPDNVTDSIWSTFEDSDITDSYESFSDSQQDSLDSWQNSSFFEMPTDSVSDAEDDLIPKPEAISPFARALALTLPQKIQTGRLDPFWSFPIPYRPFLSVAIHYRTHDLCPHLPSLDGHGENAQLALFTRYMEIPGHIFASALIAAAPLREHQLQHGVADADYAITSSDMAWLRGCALSGLNKVLSEPEKMSLLELEGCIGIVMTLLHYEVSFGDASLEPVHLEGIRRLIRFAGGMECLSPLLQKVLIFMAGEAARVLAGALRPYRRLRKWAELQDRVLQDVS